jgi:ketosteroid isomerase-like protein
MTDSRSVDPRVARVVTFFEQLSPADLPRIADFYVADARFKDPFNDVQGVTAIGSVFAHMYRALDAPRFFVRDMLADGDQCFLAWDLQFRFKRFAPAAIKSCTAPRTCGLRPTAASRCTATTGTPPRNCTRNCRRSAR